MEDQEHYIPNSFKGDTPPAVWHGEPLVPPVTFVLGAHVRHETHGDGVVVGVGVFYNDVTMGRYTLGVDPTPIPKIIVAFDHVRVFKGNEVYELEEVRDPQWHDLGVAIGRPEWGTT